MQSILDAINEWIKEILIGAINGNLSTMFGDVNEKVGTIAAEVGQTPQGWNAGIFSMIQSLSENVIVPIAGLVITYVLCVELISMVTEKNNMHDIDTFMFFKWFFKAWVAVYLVTHTFTITMAVFDMAQHVVSGAAGVIGGDTNIDVDAALSSMQAGLDAMEIPELLMLVMETTSNPISRFWQKQKIKRQYAKEARNTAKGIKGAAERTRKAAAKAAEKTKQTAAFVARHPAGVAIAVGVLLLFIMVMSGLSSCGAMFSGTLNGVLGTSYTSEDSDLVEVENSYAGLENELQSRIDNIERDNPGYDEYRYDLANIGHNPHELASYLTAKYQSYTCAEVQSELQRIFNQQYKLTLTEEVEIRYREEERTDTWTDEDGNEHTDTYTVQVPYEYYILNVKLTNTPLSTIAENNLTPEQLEMYRVYLQTSGNKPLIFGRGSPDTSASEDLSGVDFVNGTRPGNTAIVDLAKRQVGNVGGYPYWSWYGFNSRVEWCACFVSWCYGQMGLSEPRFAACQSQGIPWFTSHGQWGARGYENIAPGDAIFFDWDLDGSADHVGLVIGRDESRVYTVEGNSGDACKIKSYPLDYACIKGYGLMNWN